VDTLIVEASGGTGTESDAGRSISAVSWGAVIAGAFVIAATGLILLALGAGFGLSSVSPWPNAGVTVTTFGVMAAIWLVIVQWLSSAVGGYVAGRLRTRWTGVHTDEVYFRDTAHGVLAWAVAAVVSAVALASVATLLAGGAALGTATVAAGPAAGGGQGAGQNAGAGGNMPYLVDRMFRSDQPANGNGGQDRRGEATRILVSDMRSGDVPGADRTYLAHLVAAQTGISQDDAQKRVDDAVAQARQAADDARKAAMKFSLFTGFAMLVGVFIAAVAAKIGGHRRDEFGTV
jgi:hypothetical protein